MALMNRQDYIESLRKLDIKVYMFGELVENPVDHPIIRPSINSVAMTYELASRQSGAQKRDGQKYRKDSERKG
ncbi:MAG: Gamma-aminobutyrate metabolism dehydratase/isomerase [Clostridiales bacterium 38_11]|nr:MAG: Gamma-aminobutyrate metabolism dehydratase/isomerase [Clostridiales bacterium 38_11]